MKTEKQDGMLNPDMPAEAVTDDARRQAFLMRVGLALDVFLRKEKYKTVKDAQKAIVDFLREYLEITPQQYDFPAPIEDAREAALKEMPREDYAEAYEVTDWFENNYDAIRTALSHAAEDGVSGWRPISEAKKLKKGFMRVYSFKPVFHDKFRRYCDLLRAFDFRQGMGHRECDLFIDIPQPPQEQAHEEG